MTFPHRIVWVSADRGTILILDEDEFASGGLAEADPAAACADDAGRRRRAPVSAFPPGDDGYLDYAEMVDYAHAQSSYDEIHVGNPMDWLYATYGILSSTFEMGNAFHMPDEAIATETSRTMEAANYAIEQSADGAGEDPGAPILLPDTAVVNDLGIAPGESIPTAPLSP